MRDGLMYRALLCLFVCMSMIRFTTSFAPARAQEGVVWEVRGNRAPLLAEPNGSSAVVASLRKGEALRVLGDAQHRTGVLKPIDVGTLTPSISWYVPVEVISTQQTGWLPELRVRATLITVATPPTLPAPAPEPEPALAPVPGNVTREPTITPEEAAYIAAVLPITAEIPASVTRASQLLESPEVGNAEWVALLQNELNYWHSLYDQAVVVAPPASLTNVHSTLLLGLSLLVDSGDLAMTSLRVLGITGLKGAPVFSEVSPALMNEAARLLEEYMVNRGVTPP